MNILFLTRRFYPDVGGVEKHVLKISELLIKEGHSVTLVTESQGKEDNFHGIKILRIKTSNSWFKKFEIWFWLWSNRQIIKQADVVHAHDVYYWYFPFRFIFPNKRSFVTFHGYESYPIKKRSIIIRKISEKLSDGNIIVGDFIKKWYGTKPNYVIYGAVDVPQKLKTAGNKESAVFMGRLDEHTGILEYAKAIDLIKNNYPKFKFKILGDGKYKSKLTRYNPTGFINNPEKEFIKYNFAFSSRYLSILEALANKKLVIAYYDNPVKEDYLKMAPFARHISIVNSPESIQERIEYFLSHPGEEEKIVTQGYLWVSRFSWDFLVNQYFGLWKK